MFTLNKLILIVFTTLLIIKLSKTEDIKPIIKSDKSDFKRSLVKDCATSYSSTCFKLDVVSWVDKLNEDDNLSVMPGVTVVRESRSDKTSTADIVTELARVFPNDPNSRLDAFLMRKVTGYLNSHSVKLDLWNNNDANIEKGRGGGGGGGGIGGGGGGKGGGGIIHILAAGAMMKGTLLALTIGGIAVIAGKALMTSLISLLLSAIIGLKALSHGGHKHTTYEVVAKPVFSHANTHSHEEHSSGGGGGGGYGHSSYGRSFDTPLPLGLQSDYKPA